MYIHLYRNQPQGSAITGRLVIDGRWFCNTLERVGYQIPALCYHVAVTHSPKFKRLLPLVCGVPQSRSLGVTSEQAQSANEHLNSKASEPRSPLRTGIRFHRGTKPQHSTGCILVPADKEKQLTDLILKTQHNHEEIILDVTDFRPGTPRGYNTPCPPELQKP
jgi:hypothetical protein